HNLKKATTQHPQVLPQTKVILRFSRTSSLLSCLCVVDHANSSAHSFPIFWKQPGLFHHERDTANLNQLPFPKSPGLFKGSKNPSFPMRHLKPQLLETPPLPRLHELAPRREPSTQPPALPLPLSPPQPGRRQESRAGLRPRGHRTLGRPRRHDNPGPFSPQGASARALGGAQADPNAGKTLGTGPRLGDDRRRARPSGLPPCRPGRANFLGENRSSLSGGGAALSPGPTN
uniref:Uncharacterized protein n=1 Tax=Catagonus wagneri TaxID=51154 RepID=A0A8C3VRM5_9CETA